jgi:DNA-binding transcriptional regulator YhcF (GntR family)
MRLDIDTSGGEPPYEQVRRQVALQAADGTLPAGHRLPTVRALATDLGLAANTVAKAYRALEVDGVIETRGRQGTFVASRRMDDGAAVEAAVAFTAVARRQGLSLPEAQRLVQQEWS